MFSRKYDRVSRFSASKAIYSERAARGSDGVAQVGPWREQGRAAPGRRLGAVGPPAAPLLAPSLFLRENNSRKFADDSEKLPRTTFLK